MSASTYDKHGIAKLLLGAHKIDANAKDYSNITALILASINGL